MKKILYTKENLNGTQKVNYEIAVSVREQSNCSVFFHHDHFFNDKRICYILFFNLINPFIIAMIFYFVS